MIEPPSPRLTVRHSTARPLLPATHQLIHSIWCCSELYETYQRHSLKLISITDNMIMTNIKHAFCVKRNLLRRYVARCLLDLVTSTNLVKRYQSAYKSHHSVETALGLVQNDIIVAVWSNFSSTRQVSRLRLR